MCVCVCMRVCMLSSVQIFTTPCTVAHQAPLSMGFPRQEYWSGLLIPLPGDLPSPGIELLSLTLAGGFFTTGILYLGSPCKGAIILQLRIERGFPGGSDGKESAWIAGDPGSISGLGRCPGKGHDNPLQYSCLVNPMDRGAWQATVHGVAKSQTWLNDQHLKKNLVVNNTQWMDIYY